MAHIHSVYDSDTHFSIHPVTRTLKNESSTKTSVIQYDHNSERFTFEVPRYIEGHDMSLCNVIQVHYINIDAQTKKQNKGMYEVNDMQISPAGDDVVILSWLISQNATQLVGSLNFLIRFACVTDDVIDYAWNTAIYAGISVSSGIYNSEVIVEEYVDILEQWRKELVGISDIVQTTSSNLDGGINIIKVFLTDGTEQVFTVKNGSKGDPGYTPVKGVDYCTDEEVDEFTSVKDFTLNRTKFEYAGSQVQFETFSGCPLNCVSHFDPTQVGSGFDSVKLVHCGKNLLPLPTEITKAGVSIIPQNDGGIRIIGTNTNTSGTSTFCTIDFAAVLTGSYMISLGNSEAFGDDLQIRLMNGSESLMNTNISAASANASRVITFNEQPVTAWNIRTGGGVTYDVTIYPMLEVGSSRTEFEAYQGKSFILDFGQTVYGGTLVWNTGILTITHGADGALLSTPETVQLNLHEIIALDGVNTIYANIGDISVSGRKDIVALTDYLLKQNAALKATISSIIANNV